jgi:hypothetical protein
MLSNLAETLHSSAKLKKKTSSQNLRSLTQKTKNWRHNVFFRRFGKYFFIATGIYSINEIINPYTGSSPLMLFFETLTKQCKQKTVLLEEWFSTKTQK